MRGSIKEAIKLSKGAYKKYQNEIFLLTAGLCHWYLKNYKTAEILFLKVLACGHYDLYAHRHLANIYAALKDFDKAFFHFDFCIDEMWGEQRFINDYAYTLYEIGRFEQAKEIFEMGLILYPDEESLLSNYEYLLGLEP